MGTIEIRQLDVREKILQKGVITMDKKQTAETVTYRVVSETGLNVRAEANTYAEIVRVLPFGAVVPPAGKPKKDTAGGKWLPVENGFVCMDYIEKTE